MINVSKSYLPDLNEYVGYLKEIWESVHLTNNGPFVRKLEEQLKDFLGVEHLLFCSNGTIVLQMAIKAMGLTKEIITTPFSYCATSHVIQWEHCTPVFADIRSDDYTIDPEKIEPLITENTQAILATHVYGNACRIEEIETLAQQYGLKVIYDGAHAFGATFRGRSVLSYGDISTCSFHATKVFHTVEGGIIICNDAALANQLSLFRSFGHRFDDYYDVGINAKNSEIHAAMGLCNLPHVPTLIAERRRRFDWYDAQLNFSALERPRLQPGMEYNFAYYPILLASERKLKGVKEALEKEAIYPRRYFYPSLNTLPFLHSNTSCPISEDIALRILCLPMYPDLSEKDVNRICTIVNENL